MTSSTALRPTRASQGCADSCASVSGAWRPASRSVRPNAFGLEAVSTYCQDTVFRWQGPDQPAEEDLRAAGRRIAGVVLGSDRLAPEQREAHVREAAESSFR